MIDIFDFIEINWWIFVFNIITTVSMFFLFKKRMEMVDVIMLFSTIFFIYFYSGLGASFQIVPIYYTFMYNVLLLMYLSAFKFSMKFKTPKPSEFSLKILFKYYKVIIYFFILLSFVNAGYPSFNIIKLIKPSSPVLNFDLTSSSSSNAFKSILYYIILILEPFYLVSLFRYRDKPFKLFILLFLPLYFYFSLGGYVARSTLLPYLFIYFYLIYLYNPQYRNKIKYFGLISFLPLVILAFYYSEIRIGNESSSFDPISIIGTVFIQEGVFPLYFAQIYKMNLDTQIFQFFKWLLVLPVPSFLKGDSFGLYVNQYFTELITGKNKYSEGFSILLPGNVTESFLIFGKYLFFLLPLISGCINGLIYKLFKSSQTFIPLRIYFIFMFIPLFSRASFNSAIPVAINGYLIFIFFVFFKYRNHNKRIQSL